MDTKPNSCSEPVFVITRVFEVPRDLAWKAFTEPERMKQWWGPKGYTVIVSNMDFRPGGTYHYCLQAPNGMKMWGKFVYREISAPEKFVAVTSFSDEKQGVTRHPMSPSWPLLMLSTFTFTEDKGNTTLTVQWSPISPTDEELKTFKDGTSAMIQGWTGTLDQLSDYLAGADHELVIMRTFDAPQEVVFRAWTDPKVMAQWWGPKGFTTPLCELDVRQNGAIHIHMKGPDGTIYPMMGAYKEIIRPELLVFSGIPLDDKESPLFETLNRVMFIKQRNETRLTLRVRVVMKTPEAAPYIEGMLQGWAESLDRLASHLAKV